MDVYSPVFHPHRKVTPTQRVIRGYWWEPSNNGRLCGKGVPTVWVVWKRPLFIPGYLEYYWSCMVHCTVPPPLGRAAPNMFNYLFTNLLVDIKLSVDFLDVRGGFAVFFDRKRFFITSMNALPRLFSGCMHKERWSIEPGLTRCTFWIIDCVCTWSR